MSMLAILAASAAFYGVDPYVLQAVCYEESGLNPRAVHILDGDGTPSWGLCQVKSRTAKGLGEPCDGGSLLQPETNSRVAARYLRSLLRGDGYEGAVCRYSGNRHRHCKYAQRVLKHARELGWHGETP